MCFVKDYSFSFLFLEGEFFPYSGPSSIHILPYLSRNFSSPPLKQILSTPVLFIYEPASSA